MAKPRKEYLYGIITQDGALRFNSNLELSKVKAKHLGKEVQILIEPKKKLRSLRENNYYWGVVIPMIAEHCGYTNEEMHDTLRTTFLGNYDPRTGLKKVRSTSSLSTIEFEEYLTKIRSVLAPTLNLFIPLPNEEIY